MQGVSLAHNEGGHCICLGTHSTYARPGLYTQCQDHHSHRWTSTLSVRNDAVQREVSGCQVRRRYQLSGWRRRAGNLVSRVAIWAFGNQVQPDLPPTAHLSILRIKAQRAREAEQRRSSKATQAAATSLCQHTPATPTKASRRPTISLIDLTTPARDCATSCSPSHHAHLQEALDLGLVGPTHFIQRHDLRDDARCLPRAQKGQKSQVS